MDKPKQITAKRQKHLDRQAKKLLNLYTKEERKEKIDKCIEELNKLQLTKNFNEDTQMIYKMLEDYVENGTPYSGNKPIEGTKRVFLYLLPKDKKSEISTMLKYNEAI